MQCMELNLFPGITRKSFPIDFYFAYFSVPSLFDRMLCGCVVCVCVCRSLLAAVNSGCFHFVRRSVEFRRQTRAMNCKRRFYIQQKHQIMLPCIESSCVVASTRCSISSQHIYHVFVYVDRMTIEWHTHKPVHTSTDTISCASFVAVLSLSFTFFSKPCIIRICKIRINCSCSSNLFGIRASFFPDSIRFCYMVNDNDVKTTAHSLLVTNVCS